MSNNKILNINKTGNVKVLPSSSTKSTLIGARYVVIEPIKNGIATTKNPFVIGKTINKNAGKPLEVRSIRNGTSYLVKCDSLEQANKLIKVTQLIDNTTVKISMHKTLNSNRCVVFCKEALDMSEEELVEELKPQGVLEVKRLTRKADGNVTPLPTLILTLDGTTTPETINFGALRLRTRAYYPSPLLCYNCLRFGHMAKVCKGAKRCSKCSQEHDDTMCESETSCVNCKGEHSALDKKCPVYRKELEIVKIKINKGISFNDAKREYNSTHQRRPTYAEVSKINVRMEQARNQPGPATSGHVDFKALHEASRSEIEDLKKVNNELIKQVLDLNKKVTELTQLLAQNTTRSRVEALPTTVPSRRAGDFAAATVAGVKLSEEEKVASLAGNLATPKRFVEPEKPNDNKRKKKNSKKNRSGSSRSGSEMEEGL